MCCCTVSSNKILDLSELKTFADNNSNVNKELKFTLGRAENIVEKGGNNGYHHFLHFPKCFHFQASSLWSSKVVIAW